MTRPTVRVGYRDHKEQVVFVQRGEQHGCYLFGPDETDIEDRAEALFLAEYDPDQPDLFDSHTAGETP